MTSHRRFRTRTLLGRFFMQCHAALLLLTVFTIMQARGQIVPDSQTRLLSKVMTNVPTALTVGTNGPNTVLIVTNGTYLTNAQHAYIGYFPAARSNRVDLGTSSTLWAIKSNLYVGFQGPANRLLIASGAVVQNQSTTLGEAVSSSNNVATLRSSGTRLTTGTMYIGRNGGGNSLTVSSGADLVSGTTFLGAASQSNTVVVTGAGSSWTNSSDVYVGNTTSKNRLEVRDGAYVVNSQALIGGHSSATGNSALVTDFGSRWNNSALTVGFAGTGHHLVVSNGASLSSSQASFSSSTSSSNNYAIITGAGTTWSNNASIILGEMGPGNQLSVSNGAAIRTAGLTLGNTASATNNMVRNDSGTLIVSNAAGSATLDIRRGIVSMNAGSLWTDRLFITNSAGTFALNGGTAVVRAGTIANGKDFLIGNSATAPATLDLRRGASAVSVAGNLIVGSNTPLHQLLVTNGQHLLVTGSGFLGYTNGSHSNLAVIAANSYWSNGTSLHIGRGINSGNSVIVSNSGTVTVGSNVVVGSNLSSSNYLLIAGGTLRATNAPGNGLLEVLKGKAQLNSGTVEVDHLRVPTQDGRFEFNGGTLRARSGFISSGLLNPFVVGTSGAFPATLDLRGNSNFIVQTSFILGSNSPQNSLRVTSGHQLLASAGSEIGKNSSASDNLAQITGPGSIWTNSSLQVGTGGSRNGVQITDGASVRSGFTRLGDTAGANLNYIRVEGTGSLLTNISDLYVGSSGMENLLSVSEGARVLAGTNVHVGHGSGGHGNMIQVDGLGSVLQTRQFLNIGTVGDANHLVISNGGFVQNDEGRLGFSGSNNMAVVTGTGSRWHNQRDLLVGVSGSGNTLRIQNGGLLSLGFDAYIGAGATAKSNSVHVTDAGSSWQGGSLHLGSAGTASSMTLSNGASARISSTRIGDSVSSRKNRAIIDGSQSSWTNQSDFSVGHEGSENELHLAGGGKLFSNNGFIGRLGTSSNNFGAIRGSGSLWSNVDSLYIGSTGSSNRLEVSQGGTLSSGTGYIGNDQFSSNNTAVISGSGSLWTNRFWFYQGYSGRGNSVIITNSGLLRAANTIVGNTMAGQNNLLVVQGAGSKLEGGNVVKIGEEGAYNSLIVTNGAHAISSSTHIGSGLNSLGNRLVVSGSGSLLSNNSLNVGEAGRANTLLIQDGGKAIGSTAIVGNQSSSFSNLVVVSGAGSLWTNTQSLSIGLLGEKNRVIVSNGAAIRTKSSTIGSGLAASNNLVSVQSPESLMQVDTSLSLGHNGKSNQLQLIEGGRLNVESLITIGVNTTSASNVLRVSDAGSIATAGRLMIGNLGYDNLLLVQNGGSTTNREVYISNSDLSFRNGAVITDPGSKWIILSNLHIGHIGNSGSMVVSNGARVESEFAALGAMVDSSGNEVTVIGNGSTWTNSAALQVGSDGSQNVMRILAGGKVFSGSGELGGKVNSLNNTVVIDGPGSTWEIKTNLNVGMNGSDRAHLVLSNGATVKVGKNLSLGVNPNIHNRMEIEGATLLVTNATQDGTLLGGGGTNLLSSGTILADRFWVGQPAGVFQFEGGVLNVRTSYVNNGKNFIVGSGSKPATMRLMGDNGHRFLDGITISNNAVLTGEGSIIGSLTNYGTLQPGDAIGRLAFTTSPSLQGSVVMQINKEISLTNDILQISGPISYGGTLTIEKTGTKDLSAGDQFKVFDATSYNGAFASIQLPPLAAGLAWTNKLALDGSLAVVATAPPRFDSISIVGTNMVFGVTGGTPNATALLFSSLHLGIPLVEWIPVSTNQFDGQGSVVFITPANTNEPQRYFTLGVE